MLTRWQLLSSREKRMVACGAIAVSVFLAYELLWAPLVHKNEMLRQRIQKQHTLLTWMKNADQQISTRTTTTLPKKNYSTAALLDVLQTQLKQSPLAHSAAQFQQTGRDAVQVTFEKVSFDALMLWLNNLSLQNGIVVSEMVIVSQDIPGIVKASIILKPF